MEEEAGRKEGTPANRQLSARASEKGDNYVGKKPNHLVLQVVTVRKQKQRAKPAAAAPQKSRFQNFKQVGTLPDLVMGWRATFFGKHQQNWFQVEQHRSAPVQQQPRREQAYFQPAPQQPVQPAYQQPAFKQQTFQQPQQPQRAAYQQPAYQQQQQTYQQPQQVAAYPRAQHQTYTQEVFSKHTFTHISHVW